MPTHESPVELTPCRLCGRAAELHRARSGKWYVKCSKKKCENRTEESTSKLMICRAWNLRQKESSHV